MTAICAGRPARLPGGKLSAIAKAPIEGPVLIIRLGLAGDTQVDQRHHGGPDMAVHVYPLAHRAFWRELIGEHPLLAEPGGFGSNLAVDAITEDEVRLGERFRLGGALLEVCQPRMPCVTIERRFERGGMVKAVLKSGRCGWFFRVVEEGHAQASDRLEAVPGTGCELTIRQIFAALATPDAAADPQLIERLASSPVLGHDWRKRAKQRVA